MLSQGEKKIVCIILGDLSLLILEQWFSTFHGTSRQALLSNNVHPTDIIPISPAEAGNSFVYRQSWICRLGHGVQHFILSLHQTRNPKTKTLPALPEEERRRASNPFKHNGDSLSRLLPIYPTLSSTVLA